MDIAATRPLLLEAWERRTGDRAFLERWRARILDLAYLPLHLRDEADGLVRCMPGERGSKYFMDNCEVVAGLRAFAVACGSLMDNGESFRLVLVVTGETWTTAEVMPN